MHTASRLFRIMRHRSVQSSERQPGIVTASSRLAVFLTLGLAACQSVENIGFWDRPAAGTETRDTQTATEFQGDSSSSEDTWTDTANDTDALDSNTTFPDTTDTQNSDSGSMDSDTADSDTADSDTADSNIGIVRVPFSPQPQTIVPMLKVNADDNILGEPGGWFHYDYQ